MTSRTLPQNIATAIALYPLIGGLVTLIGWVAGLPRLTDWKGDGISMFPNAAICAVASSAALILLNLPGRPRRRAAQVLATFVVAVGSLTLAEHLLGGDFGIDTLVITATPWGQSAAASPMRMGPPASTSFVLLGTSLLLLVSGAAARKAGVVLGVMALAIGTLSLTGHLYGAQQMYTLPRLTGIAMQTASMIVALALGVIASVPERDPLRVMLERSAAGILARQALPILIVMAVLIGWFRVELEDQGLVDSSFGTALRTLVEIGLMTWLLWRALRSVREHETALADSEAAVRRQAAQLAGFLDTAAIGLHRIDANGIVVWANDAELQTFGYARDEFVGRPVTDFHADPEVIDDILATLHDGGKVLDRQARMVCKDGSIKTVLIDSSVFRDDGRFVHTQCFTRDITERVQAEQTRALLASIVQASEDVVISKSLDGIITSWNPAATRLFGYSADEAVGRSIELIIPPDRLSEEKDIQARLRRGEGIEHYETIRRRKNGELFDISISVSPIRDATGRVIGASKIARDITERKRIEAEREEASRRKDEFIAILAHELRNPLAPVRNAAHYLKELALPQIARPVEMIERQVAQMSRLIDDLLDVSRISRGVLELRRERIDCGETVEAAVDATRGELEARGHTLHCRLPELPVELDADRERLVQILCNLLGNASKYTPPGGSIELAVSVSGANLLISVKDDGLGIPADKLADIFDLFVRVDHSLEGQGGLGIGLTLARQIVALHGGSIEARSDGVGTGSEFIVDLPVVVTVPRRAEAERNGREHPSVRRRILVADDNRDAAESLAMLLHYAGHDVHTAFDGDEAVRAAEELQPDVALLDIGMPKANGYEVARMIRQQPWGDRIVLVALTGWGQESDKQRARDAGFDTHLLKPVDPEVIEDLLAALPADRQAPAKAS